ncbi:zinc ribbon domain-containing protein [Alkalibacterium sp. f15]|uniref:zinc ribbon domain-containing protein n=1 Tax=Alkalibacterium sp. f15 TaxID=3414029 RepID=UPI003BF89943
MNYCEECGHKLEYEQKFCQGCGAAVVPKDTNSSQGDPHITKEPKHPEKKGASSSKKPFPKGVIVTSVLVIFLSVAGYFSYQYGQDYYSVRNQVDRMVKILHSKDYESIAANLTSTHDELEIDEDTIKPYVDVYLTDVDAIELRKALATERSYESLKLVPKGSYFYLFDKYELELLPAFVTLSTNMENVTFSINAEEVVVSDEEDFSFEHGPLIPGEYVFSAVTKIDGHELMTEENSYVTASQDNVLIDLPIQGFSFTVESNLDDPFVYINDKEIGQLQNGSGHFGPFGSLNESQLELRKEESFGELKTSAITMSAFDEENYYLKFQESLNIDSAEMALRDMYYTLSGMTQDDNYDLEGLIEDFGNYFYQGVAYDELRPFFIDYAERQRENEDADRTTYDVTLTNFNQVGMKEYTVDLEVDYITEYDWSLDKENRIRTFTYNVSLIADEAIRDTWANEEELFIDGFGSEELIYDSNE